MWIDVRQAMANSSEWVRAFEKRAIRGVDLQDWLKQDKKRIYEVLESYRLPFPPALMVPWDRMFSEEIDRMFERSGYFCRLIPKDRSAIRPFRERLASAGEFRDFVGAYDPRGYDIQISEQGIVTHTGGMVVHENPDHAQFTCLVELVEGKGPDLFHGKKNPVNVVAGPFRDIECRTVASDEELGFIRTALRHVGWPNNPMPGYFEFMVWDRERLLFRNYQPPGSGYARLDRLRRAEDWDGD